MNYDDKPNIVKRPTQDETLYTGGSATGLFWIGIILLLMLIALNKKAIPADYDGLKLEPHEVEIIKLTNEYRVKNGRKPLIASRRLVGTARLQSWHMTKRGMSHGFTRGWSAENIAQGQRSPKEVVNTWINSSGHRVNMLGNWKYIGVSGYDRSWTQQFSNN